jgi:hypothetical protein
VRQYASLWKGRLAGAPGWLTGHGWQVEFHQLTTLGLSYRRPVPDAARSGLLTALRTDP